METSAKPKLPRLPPTHRITKRAILRPPIPSLYRSAASPKVVWVKNRTPFSATVARVNGLLEQARKREEGRSADERLLARGKVDDNKAKNTSKLLKDLQTTTKEPVFLKGAGKAIKRVLELGLWFQQRGGYYRVQVRTGETSVVDDIEEVETLDGHGESDGGSASGDVNEDSMKVDKPDLVLPPTRIRKLSTIEIEIRLL